MGGIDAHIFDFEFQVAYAGIHEAYEPPSREVELDDFAGAKRVLFFVAGVLPPSFGLDNGGSLGVVEK